MISDQRLQELVEKVNSKMRSPSLQQNLNLISTHPKTYSAIKASLERTGAQHDLKQIDLNYNFFYDENDSDNELIKIANHIAVSTTKSYVFFSSSSNKQFAKNLANKLCDVSRVSFFQYCKSDCPIYPMKCCTEVDDKKLDNLLTSNCFTTNSSNLNNLDFARALFKEAGFYDVRTPFL
jgi:hypothetical protein